MSKGGAKKRRPRTEWEFEFIHHSSEDDVLSEAINIIMSDAELHEPDQDSISFSDNDKQN